MKLVPRTNLGLENILFFIFGQQIKSDKQI